MNKIFIRYFSASPGLRSSAGKMKGILVKNFGGPEACEYETNIPIPEPNDDQIQIRVHAAGVNPIDTYIRAGKHERRPKLPFTPGMDSAGIVSKLGKNVKDFKVGDRVFTTDSDTGTYAEYTLTKPKNTYQLADNISFEEGSGIGIPYFTAYKALFLKANSKPGETVLVHGASGATGLATVQLAKAHGMKVIGTAGTQSGLDLIKKQGADYSFNHRDSNYIKEIKTNFPNGLDLIVEMLANINLNNDLTLLKYKKGKVAIIGNRGTIEINPRLLMINETSIFGVIQYSTTHEEFIMMNHHLGAMFKSNVIKPLIGRRYKLSEAGKAQHDVINNTGSGGKLTLIVD